MKADSTSRVAQGASILFLNGLIVYILRFAYRLITSRHLGAEDYGLLSLALTIVGIAGLLATLGMNNGIVKYIGHYAGLQRVREIKGVVVSAVGMSFVTACFVSVVLVFSSHFIATTIFHNVRLQPLLIICAFSIPLLTSQKLFGKAFVALKRPVFSMYAGTFGKELSLLLFSIGIVLFKGGVEHLLIAQVACLLVGLAVTTYLLRWLDPILLQAKAKFNVKQLLTYSLPLFLSAIFVQVMGYADTILIGTLMDISSVGIYNVALPFASSLTIFLAAFSSMFFPVAAELKARKELDELGNLYTTIARWGFFLSFPFFMVAILFSEPLILNLFGQEYVGGSVAFVVLLCGVFSNIITGPAVELLKAFSRVKLIFWLNTGSAIVNVVLNLLLIPKLGIFGAALATSISLAMREIILLMIISRYIPIHFSFASYVKYLIAISVPVLLLKFLQPTTDIGLITLGLLCSSFVAIYFFVVALLGFNQRDKEMIRRINKKLKINFLRKLSE